MPPKLGERLLMTSHNVGAGDKDIVVPEKKEKTPITKELFEEYKNSLQKMLDKNRGLLEAFSGDVSLEFIVADKYAIDFESGKVYLDATTLHERKETEEQALWSVLHELSHFLDYVEDKKGILDNFKHIQRKAKKIAPKIERKVVEAFGESHPELVESIKKKQPSGSKTLEPMSWAEQAGYKMYHTFYNCLDDIHVNARLTWKAQRYRPEAEGGQAVKTLYRDTLFPGNDYAEHPKHMQMPYKLLRESMVPDQNVILTERVFQEFENKIPLMGKSLTPKEWANEILIPGVKKDKRTGKSQIKQVSASARNAVIRQTLEPVFDRLLLEDLEEWEPKLPAPPNEGMEQGASGMPQMPWEKEYKEFTNMSPDQAPEGFYEDLAEQVIEMKEEQKNEEEKKNESQGKTPVQRAQELKDAADREWCRKNDLTLEQFREYEQLEKKIEPYLDELSNLWTKILRGLRIEQGRRMEGYFQTGELDVEKVVEEWPKIEQAKFDEVRVMERQLPKEILIRKPEEIRIRLLGDNSGSMNGERIEMLKQVATLILSSVREFNARMAWQSSEGDVVTAKSQVVLYGHDHVVAKPLEAANGDQESVDMRKAVTACNASGNDTLDALALHEVWKTINTPEEQERIKSGKVIDIMFEITDGGTGTLHQSMQIIKKLKEAGVITKAFQVGTAHEGEKKVFNTEWKEDGKIVGKDLSKVVPAIAEMLEKIIGEKF
ncbi:VWA domain-containing protein [Candidatus Uhrbacteria bacterium]|nr:VWA domain-containing protein [Candidatus Uhrbacteria bacterium]